MSSFASECNRALHFNISGLVAFLPFPGFPQAIKELLTNVTYVVMMLSDILGAYLLTGVYINVPRYLESHFLLPAFKANIVAGQVS